MPAAALARELREELGVDCPIGPEIYRTRHRYTELQDEIELIFFSVKSPASLPRNLAFEQILWVEPKQLPRFDFLPADRELIELLASGALRIP